MGYLGRVDDPWFQAQVSFPADGVVFWSTANPASVLGCAEQYEFCNGERCSNFADDASTITEKLDGLGFNARQTSVLKKLLTTPEKSSLYVLVTAQGGLDMLANRRIIN